MNGNGNGDAEWESVSHEYLPTHPTNWDEFLTMVI